MFLENDTTTDFLNFGGKYVHSQFKISDIYPTSFYTWFKF